MKKGIMALTLVLFLSPALTFSADYKDWLPYIPDTIGGKKKSRKDDAGNVNITGFTSSTINRTFGKESDEITLLIIWDPSGRQMIATKTMMEAVKQRPIETPDVVQKRIIVQGFPAFYLYASGPSGASIYVLLSESALVQLSALGSRNESYYINLLKSVNLKKILNTM